jgi:tetratricopeptide (TPR) repeat protein
MKIMKNIKYILFSVVILLASCEDFLKEEPVDRLTQFNFYSSADDAEAAVNAIYTQLWVKYYERDIQLMADVTCDDVKNGDGMQNSFLQELEFLRVTPDNTFTQGVWQWAYDMINRANVAINNIGDENMITMDEDFRKSLIGEAKFLRGVAYFNTVRLWGSVPLILEINEISDAYAVAAPVSDIYDQIIEDFTYAAENLPYSYSASDYGRATKGAAKVFLAKAYLTIERWQDAADILNEVVSNEGTYGFGLYEDYKDNWTIATQHGIENIIGIDFTNRPEGNGNKLMQATGPKQSVMPGGVLPGIKASWESEIPSLETFNRFDDADERKAATYRDEFTGPKNGKTYFTNKPMIAKYFEDGEADARNGDLDFIILRYSDVLLMLAESLNELNQTATAYTHLNRVRERAFNDTDHNYSGLSQSDFREAVLLERQLEFVHEGHRFFDLVRTGRFVQRMKEHGQAEFDLTGEQGKLDMVSGISEKYTLFPIPQRERDLNLDLGQNPGY